MGETSEAPRTPNGHAPLTSLELYWLRIFIPVWASLSDEDRAAFVKEFVYLRTLHRANDKKAEDDKTATNTKRWRLTAGIAAGAMLFAGLTAVVDVVAVTAAVNSAKQAEPPQKVIVEYPNGTQVVVTPAPTPTATPDP